MLALLLTTHFLTTQVDRGFLNVYVFFIGLNAISAIVLILKCASTEWSRLSPEGRARRERAVLICDMVCDALCTYYAE